MLVLLATFGCRACMEDNPGAEKPDPARGVKAGRHPKPPTFARCFIYSLEAFLPIIDLNTGK